MRGTAGVLVFMLGLSAHADPPTDCKAEEAAVWYQTSADGKHSIVPRRPGDVDAPERLRACKARVAEEKAPLCSDARRMSPVAQAALCIEQAQLAQIRLANKARHEALARARKRLTKDAADSLGCVYIKTTGGMQCVSVEDDDTKETEEAAARIQADIKRLGLPSLSCKDPAVQWVLFCGPEGAFPDDRRCENKAMVERLSEAAAAWDGGACRTPEPLRTITSD